MPNRIEPMPHALAQIDGLTPGQVVVVRAYAIQDQVIPCQAAPVVAGTLRRHGIDVREAVLEALPDAPRGSTAPSGVRVVVHSVQPWPPLEPDPGWIGLAAAPDDPAAVERCAHLIEAISHVRRPREVHLAQPRSFCAGVERAIAVVERALELRGAPVYMRKQIVHNTGVVTDLESRGAVFVDELAEVPPGSTVVFSAHGVSPAVRAEAARRGLDVIDATCPLVGKVHAEARRFAERGDTIVLIGHAGHEETEGTLGHAPDSMLLVERADDIDELDVPDGAAVSYLTQTTLAVDDAAEVVEALRARFPALSGPPTDDICYATTNRQNAVREVVDDAGLVLVIGSQNSSNSQRLVELARSLGTPAHLIDTAADIDLDWLVDVDAVALTAGASAPPGLVDEVVAMLDRFGPVRVQEQRGAAETVQFALPKEVRST